MASKFVALPVGRGDSFYLERGSHSVLFDGGQALHSLRDLITKHTSCVKLDVVICSHNDADHAKGLIGLFDSPTISISEVWLPGRWMEVIHRIANESEQFFHEVIVDSQDQRKISLEEMSEELSNDDRMDKGSKDLNSEEVIEDLEKLGDKSYPHLLHPIGIPLFGPYWTQLLTEAIDATDRIVKIATKARERGCQIRWFDFTEFQKTKSIGGGESWLRPLNSVEITRYKRNNLSALKFLALTVANKESLAFCSSLIDEPSVVFSADSDLAGVTLPTTLQNSIVTAPHHGAASNKAVYKMSGLNASLWVRSDMKSSKRPCPEFVSKTNKFCTRCRSKNAFEQRLEFTSNSQV